ncbi:MAG: AsmA-like C-terminal region-containing protein [Candidatus Omnitrophota bacterium]|nr:AsmA-like C-terminal region-containing protein [Candidatus Omnitrophota bacterium]
MKRKIIIGSVLILLFSIAAGILYLNNVYLPVKVKDRLANSLSTLLNYNVEIEKIKYTPIRGAVIQNIVIYDKVKDKKNIILTVKEASFQILFLPLIKERKIIIPSMHIDSPYLNIRYQQDNNFNFSRIFLPKPKPQSKPKIKLSFLIYKINIFNGKGIFEDERFTPKFSKTIQDLDIVLGIKQLTKIYFLIESKLLTDKGRVTELSFQGDYNFLSKEVNSKLNIAHLVIPEFNPYLKTLPLSIAGGTIDNGALELKFKNNLISLKGAISTKWLALKKEDLSLMGDIDFEPELSYVIDKKEIDYKANIKFIRADLIGMQYIDKINNISGDMGLIQNKLWTDNLKLQALDSAFTLKGTIDNFVNPHLKLNLKSEQLNLEKMLAILPYKTEGLNLSGAAATDINIEGYLGRPPLDIRGSLQLNDAKLQTALLKEPINNIKGQLALTEDTVNWINLSFDYLNTAYTSTGKLVSFKMPQITFGLNSKDLDLKSDIKIKDKAVRIITFAGKYINSNFAVEGGIDTQDNTNPALDLSANLDLNPSDIFVFLPANLSENLKKIKPEGILNIKGALNGSVKDYKNWNTSLKASADTFSVYNLKFTDIAFNLAQKGGLININGFTASSYSGRLNLDFISDLKPDAPAYSFKFNASGVDLAKLKLDTGAKDKDVSGTLNISADLNGNFNDLASLKGNGALSVNDGKLWQFNLFKGMGELFLLPDYGKIMFKEALGDFDIRDKSVTTENLKLTSEQLNLDCKGKLGFDGALDLTFYTEVNKNLIRDSADLRKFTAAILGGLSDALTIKVSGTIQKPKYKIVPVLVDVIKNIKDFFLGK